MPDRKTPSLMPDRNPPSDEAGRIAEGHPHGGGGHPEGGSLRYSTETREIALPIVENDDEDMKA